MRKRSKFLLGLAACGLAAGLATWFFLPRRFVTPAIMAHVKEGMSVQDVELLFQGAAALTMPPEAWGPPEQLAGCNEVKFWPGVEGEAYVGFDTDRRVKGVIMWMSKPSFLGEVGRKIDAWLERPSPAPPSPPSTAAFYAPAQK